MKKTTAVRSTPKPTQSQKPETVLVLRTCAADGLSSHDFKWPQSGPVEAPDWKPTVECGNGLHGWLWGHGNWSLKTKADKILWLVVEVEKSLVIDLAGKVKFPRGNVVGSFGAWNDAMKFIRAKYPDDPQVASATGNSGHASATGYSGWSVAGYGGKVKAGKNGVLTGLYFNEAEKRPRVVVAYVGEGIDADTWYEVKDGKLVKA